MSTSFEDRIARLSAQKAAAAQKPMPTASATTRTERLQRALALLNRAGITGASAYSPVLTSLARMGLILPPFYFWRALPLFLFGFAMFTAIFGTVIWVGMGLDHVPRPVRTMIEAGPEVFLWIMTGLSGLFAAIHVLKARSIGLPRWRQL